MSETKFNGGNIPRYTDLAELKSLSADVQIANNDCFVLLTATIQSLYAYDANSTATPDDLNVIALDNHTGSLIALGVASVGADGKSAFEIAQDNGFTGTETQWLDSLNGADGTNGADGVDGINGEDGVDGTSVTAQTITQADYDLLSPPDPNILYVIPQI